MWQRNKVVTELEASEVVTDGFIVLGQFQSSIPQYLLEEQCLHSSLGQDPGWSFPEVMKMSSISWNTPDTFQ